MITPRLRSQLSALAVIAVLAACSDPVTALTSPAAPTLSLLPTLRPVARVSGLTVPKNVIPLGRTTTGTVSVQGRSIGTVEVKLASTDPASVVVPPSVLVDFAVGSATFPVAGARAGCARISAGIGLTQPLSKFVYVEPTPTPSGAPVSLGLSEGEILGAAGITSTGNVTVLLYPSSASSVVVQLSSSNPVVAVPAKVTVPLEPIEGTTAVTGHVSFPINVKTTVYDAGCTVITAATGLAQSRKLLRIAPFSAGG